MLTKEQKDMIYELHDVVYDAYAIGCTSTERDCSKCPFRYSENKVSYPLCGINVINKVVEYIEEQTGIHPSE